MRLNQGGRRRRAASRSREGDCRGQCQRRNNCAQYRRTIEYSYSLWSSSHSGAGIGSIGRCCRRRHQHFRLCRRYFFWPDILILLKENREAFNCHWRTLSSFARVDNALDLGSNGLLWQAGKDTCVPVAVACSACGNLIFKSSLRVLKIETKGVGGTQKITCHSMLTWLPQK